MIIRNKANSFRLLFAWKGTILPQVLPALVIVMLISAMFGLLNSWHFLNIPTVPSIGFTIFGVILSIFIGFRNSSCYDRWWEGRKLWGALIATSRHIARDSHILNPLHRERLLHQTMVFSNVLRDRLRHQTTHPHHFLDHGYQDDDIAYFNQHINTPQHILEDMQKDLLTSLQSGEISDIIYSILSQHIVSLGNIQAGCDRIASTPLPYVSFSFRKLPPSVKSSWSNKRVLLLTVMPLRVLSEWLIAVLIMVLSAAYRSVGVNRHR